MIIIIIIITTRITMMNEWSALCIVLHYSQSAHDAPIGGKDNDDGPAAH